MRVEATYSEIWRISWPIILSSLANTVINFTDVAFVSRIGEKELAASALGGVFYFMLVMAGTAIGIGSQILISRRAGENRHPDIGGIFDHSLCILFSFAVLMMAVVYGLMPLFMNGIVKDPEVAAHVIRYLDARCWGLVFMMLLIALRSFYTGITLTRIITYTTLVMMILNLILNYAFVLGHFGFEPMGIYGSGLASALAEGAAALYAILYTFFRSTLKEYRLFKFRNMNLNDTLQILQLSAPVVLQHVLSMGSWFLFFVMIEKLGSRELALSNIVRGIYMVLMTPIWGFSQSANSMVSNLIGQAKEKEVMGLLKKIMTMSILTGIAGILLSMLFRDFLFSLTTPDARLMEDAMGSFYVVCLATFFFTISMVLLSGISGTGATAAAMFIEIICLVVYVAYVLVFTILLPAPLETVWGAEVLYWLMMGLISYHYLRSGKWLRTALKYN
ncbi:MAG: MATE family efflux transporter [Bacteroidia bacterium]|nr:MATE family efflux transporter [Bacteroidia bacterium]